MKRILLAYDGSHFAESALGDLPRMGLDDGAEICALLVVEDPNDHANFLKAEDQAQHVRRVIEGLLPHAQVESLIARGKPADEILLMATTHEPDLIVVGAHGKSVAERLLFGSVSAKVAAEAACSVRVCHPRKEPGFQHLRLTLAIDGSLGATVAVEKTLQRHWPSGTAFNVVTIIEHEDDPAAHSLATLVGRVVQEIQHTGAYAAPIVLHGNPSRSLLTHAQTWAPHCLLLGARGLQHGHNRSLGTLATAMVKQSGCSVEIIR